MDVLEFWRVARRHQRLIMVGFLLTLAAMVMLLFRPTFWGLELRSPPVYGATSTLFVTQSGFPWGRSALAEYVEARGAGESGVPVPRFADPGRMEYLASLYAELALSDDVRRGVQRSGYARADDVEEQYMARPLSTSGGGPLPLIEITGESRSQARSVGLANAAARALVMYITRRQTISEVPEDTRVVLPVVTRAVKGDVVVVKGVRLTTALMIGLLGIAGTLFAAFLVESVQRQRRFVDATDDEAPVVSPHRVRPRIAVTEDESTPQSALVRQRSRD